MYNFDEEVIREGTNSLKFDFKEERKKPKSVIPMWVADMDFKVPNEVIDALSQKALHGIFGYSESTDSYYISIKKWFSKYNYEPKKEWLVKTPGMVFAVSCAISAFTKEGEGVLIQQPLYYPFAPTIEKKGRELVVNEIILKNSKYEVDFDDFEKKIIENRVKLFILCSPHNPIMKSFTKEELLKMGGICKKHGVIVFSDEIHADFVFSGEHRVFTTLDESFSQFSIISTSPTKTFNIPGLQITNNFIANEVLRKKFEEAVFKTGYSQPNIMGIVACEAAYTYGEEWFLQMKDYLQRNIIFLKSFIKERIPQIKIPPVEATFLIWLDFSAFNKTNEQLEKILLDAGVWLSNGVDFGVGGEGFMRINIGCTLKTLKEALRRIDCEELCR